MTKLKHDKDCRCIFCNMLCRACGSTNIELEVVGRYFLNNDQEDRLCFKRDTIALAVTCNDCGTTHTTSAGDRTRRHKKLLRQIQQTVFPGVCDVSIGDDGNVKCNPIHGVVSGWSPQKKKKRNMALPITNYNPAKGGNTGGTGKRGYRLISVTPCYFWLPSTDLNPLPNCRCLQHINGAEGF